MTFYDISMKMMMANLKRYKLYFLCNVFSVALFYSFAAIFTNKSFMNPSVVDPMISGNIYTPSVLVGIFVVLFIPYSNNVFLRNRKYEYGVLITLGMDEKEVLKNMAFESLVISGLSLLGGLVLGTLLSFVFCFLIQHMIGLFSLRWYLNGDSYKITAALYCIPVIITLVTSMVKFGKTQIIDLIKDKFRAEGKQKGTWGIFIGLIARITQAEILKKWEARLAPNYRKNHMVELSFVKHHHKSRIVISVMATCLIGFSIFLAGISLVLYSGLIHNAKTQSPYDLVYSQIFGENQVKDSEIQRLLNENNVSIKEVKQVEFLRNMAFNLLPVSEANKTFHCNYQIHKGEFMMIFQFDRKDGYEHTVDDFKKITLEFGTKKMELKSSGKDVRILFNGNPTFADNTLILSDADYHKIATQNKGFWLGTMKLYSFDNWRDSKKGIAAVQKYLMEKNQVNKREQHTYYRASSRIEADTTAKQSAEFLMFLMFFIVILLYGASDIMVHFKIKAEWEGEKRLLVSLRRIGVSWDEMMKMIQHKNIYYFMPQVITGLFIGMIYNYTVNEFYGFGWESVGYSLSIGMVLVVLQSIIIIRYSRREGLGFKVNTL